MIIKNADDRSVDTQLLEQLLATASNGQRKKIESELRNLRAGLKAEKDAAYLIDFHYKDSPTFAIIHDLRLEVEGRTAQIDHLVIHRTMHLFVLETKNFHAGLKITDDGEFLRWNDFKQTYEGMPSPIAQNERHVVVVNALLKQLPMPTRLGVRLQPKITPLVLVSTNARIERSSRFDCSGVIKADILDKAIGREFEQQNVLGAVARLIGTDTLEEFARSIAAEHQPVKRDYAARFPAAARNSTRRSEEQAASGRPEGSPASKGSDTVPDCRHCGSDALIIAYGKYGYYFKCTSCSGNTPIKITCEQRGHKARLRKAGTRFYRECAECATSQLFYENPVAALSDGGA